MVDRSLGAWYNKGMKGNNAMKKFVPYAEHSVYDGTDWWIWWWHADFGDLFASAAELIRRHPEARGNIVEK